jgi:hypothetical protein
LDLKATRWNELVRLRVRGTSYSFTDPARTYTLVAAVRGQGPGGRLGPAATAKLTVGKHRK